jgi:hypothetical protein
MTPADQRLSRTRGGFGQVLAVLLTAAAIVAAGSVVVRQAEMVAPLTHSDNPLSDDEIYTGSILLPLKDETRCHQLLFDNRTGQFKDNGTVNCLEAYYKGTTQPPMQWSSMRAQVISESFRQH